MTHHDFHDLSDEIWPIILMLNSIKARQYSMSFVASSFLLKIILTPWFQFFSRFGLEVGLCHFSSLCLLIDHISSETGRGGGCSGGWGLLVANIYGERLFKMSSLVTCSWLQISMVNISQNNRY
jgi:hypothetical protein